MKNVKFDSVYPDKMLEISMDPMFSTDAIGRITDTNIAFEDITEKSRNELIGQEFRELFHLTAITELGFKNLFANGKVSHLPCSLKNKTNASVACNGSIFINKLGKAEGAIIGLHDLSNGHNKTENRSNELVIANRELAFQNEEKEKRANELAIANKELAFQNEEKENRANELVIANRELVLQNKAKEKLKIAALELQKHSLTHKLESQYARSLIEASTDPFVTISPDGKITDVNEASIKVTGVTRLNLIGTEFSDYFTEPEKARAVYKQVFENGSVSDYPLTITHKNGKLTDVLYNASAYKDDNGDTLGVFAAARDITEQKIIANQLIEARIFAEMAQNIAEVAKTNAETATRLAEYSVKAKQQFLSNMSHEIRTPMNAIIGFTKVLLKTELALKQREYLEAIKLSGDALIVLINDILDLAKVDAGKMTFEQTPFKLSQSISAMLHMFDTKIQEMNIKTSYDYDKRIPEILLGDPVRLHQIILNLVSNAVKFTSKGKITVSIRMLSEDAEKVEIEFSIADTGIGIQPDKINKIFENFQQASSGTSRLYGGTGLGLAIVKQLVEGQNGSVRVVSEPDVGSTFSFILNFKKTDQKTISNVEFIELDSEIKNIKVLVVEDIPLNQLLMKTLLDDFGFEREIASNGKIAIEMLKENKYDLILMDLQMPEMNGFEATEHIRKNMKLSIPIVALTADVTTADLAKCRSVGMNDYIAKPVDERILYSKIIGLVKKIPPLKVQEIADDEIQITERCINLDYLNTRTKSDPALMEEMIVLYLDQTPNLLVTMKTSFKNKDWNQLQAAVHKIIPSFSIMGMSPELETIAKKIKEFTSIQKDEILITEMLDKLDRVCKKACEELRLELKLIKERK